MKYIYQQFPHASKKIDICDAQIDAIQYSENNIRFVFSNGFSVLSSDGIKTSSSGYIELTECDPNEFNCYIVKREAAFPGARLYGEPISLTDIAAMLKSDNRKIEIFLELYNGNHLHWRGVLLPYKEQGLSDHIIIEVSGRYPMMYFWE